MKTSDKGWAWLGEKDVFVRGEGSSVMLEWSQPTVVATVRVLEHLNTNYGMFKREGRSGGGGQDKKSTEWISKLPRIDLELQLTDINLFLYALTPGNLTMACTVATVTIGRTPLSFHKFLASISDT